MTRTAIIEKAMVSEIHRYLNRHYESIEDLGIVELPEALEPTLRIRIRVRSKYREFQRALPRMAFGKKAFLEEVVQWAGHCYRLAQPKPGRIRRRRQLR